jgi:hypothetical protein
MDARIKVRKLHDRRDSDQHIANPVERLDLVERLRMEAGKFLYDYPTTFRRVVTVVKREQR